MRKSKLNVIIIEPSDIIVRGLCALLSENELFRVIDTLSDVARIEDKSRLKRRADIVIINPTLVCHCKRGTIRTLFPQERLVALLYSYFERDTLIQFDESIEVYDKPSKIVHKLEQVAASDDSSKFGNEGGELSDREKEILIAVAKGMINKEIADLHNISVHTVIAHRKNISRKTGIKSVSGFVVYALLNNYIEEHEVL
ncbi:LuxR family transcriptional regulator [Mucinivorans hirudinis]|uniref:LuxR family transcriptional regulator n=1 Tax=Mucinivorans hirudinis TaxID=1433126 RepID=A0A060R7M2_9BACT|nr:LuxR family transcriptional regulator [Mucinivorans hirudinis]